MRDHDIVLFGATGFVGRLIAAHLANHAGDLRIALAGRNPERLVELRDELAQPTWALITADSSDTGSLTTLAESARVVLSTVGPYARLGLPLVGACAAAGTHYVDLSGEALFVRNSIDLFDGPARAAGARIVHSCGFDSVPSDLAVAQTAAHAHAHELGDLTETVLRVTSLRGGLSGGTVASIKGQLDQAKAEDRAATLLDPYGLSPDRGAEPEPRQRFGKVLMEIAPGSGKWSAPWLMGSFNAQVVRRSNSLTGWSYGRSFRYREVQELGRGAKGFLRAAAMNATTPALTTLLTSPLRPALDRLLPKPGDGPSAEARAQGRFAMEVLAQTTSGAGVRTTIGADTDPGYDGTAIMVAEAARCLLDDELDSPAGVLTPSVAFGEPLAEHLRGFGFHLDSATV